MLRLHRSQRRFPFAAPAQPGIASLVLLTTAVTGRQSFTRRSRSRVQPRSRPHIWAGDLDPAIWAGMNRQTEAMQLDDRSNKIEAEADAGRISDLVGTIEPPQHRVALIFGNAATGVGDAHDAFVLAAQQFNVDPAAFGGKLDGVVDEVGDRFDQQIPVAAHLYFLLYSNLQGDVLVFRDRLVDIADLPQHFVQCDIAKPRRTAAVFDLCKTQQRGDDRKRLVDA